MRLQEPLGSFSPLHLPASIDPSPAQSDEWFGAHCLFSEFFIEKSLLEHGHPDNLKPLPNSIGIHASSTSRFGRDLNFVCATLLRRVLVDSPEHPRRKATQNSMHVSV